MKTTITHRLSIQISSFILVFLFSLELAAQPDYDFTTGNYIAGSPGADNQVGARYRYNSVRPGVDCRVTIVAITGGIIIDDVDGTGGFAEAFQPSIDVPAYSSGYVELRFDFYQSGTNLGTAAIQYEVPITPIDVDGQAYGSGNVYEYDLVYLPNGYIIYDATGGELVIDEPIAYWSRGRNIAAVDYPGIDTMVKRVMFTVVNGTTSSVTVRVGAENNSNATRNRLRSLYFKKFIYPFGVLPVSPLRSFNGNSNHRVVTLNWDLHKENDISTIVLEKSLDSREFTPVANFLVTTESGQRFSYVDEQVNVTTYYRLRMINNNNKTSYSNILAFKQTTAQLVPELKVFPTIVQSSFTASIPGERNEQVTLQIVDFQGRTVQQNTVTISNGQNNLQVNGMEKLPRGNYAVIVRHAKGLTYQGRILKQ